MIKNFYPVILAGGRGTRFWPLSRKRRAKQVLALDGRSSMIQQTVARLLPLAPAKNFWVITNQHLRSTIARQLPRLRAQQILAEPAGRNTAPAIGLAAFLLLRKNPKAILGLFPSDHVIGNTARFHKVLRQAAALAARGENMVVMGIPPTRPETGYGYIQAGARAASALRVKRFTEKPALPRARRFLKAGSYYWNSGMFVWSARTLVQALEEHLPQSAALLEEIAAAWGTKHFSGTLRRLYPRCENISVDYAVLEPRSARSERASGLYCLPAEFGWNDLGSWAALYEHQLHEATHDGNVLHGDGSVVLEASGNFVHAPGKFVAALGVQDLVIVDSGDALLITSRARAQDVGAVVKHLETNKRNKLL
jgi:mannose-1-phosphate guanylyltransferase